MKPVRIMPCLDIKDGRVVKGVNFVDLQDAADPVEAAIAYDQGGADELAFLDITATVEKRVPIYDVLAEVTRAVKLPVTIGGGLKTTGDLSKAFESGASAVSISSAAFRDPDFIKEAVKLFGGNRVAVALDYDLNDGLPSGREVLIDGGRTHTGRDMVEFAVKMRGLGIGSIIATSRAADGMKSGYDVYGIRQLADATGIAIVASGGAGKVEDFLAAAREGGAQVLLAASVFHFGALKIMDVKRYLHDNGIPVIMKRE